MRLIDADAIKWDKCEDAEGNPVYVLDKRDIDTQPTAYDVDKVVEQLEEKVKLAERRYFDTTANSPCHDRYKTQYNERAMCLEIVKGGGVNDD